MDELHEILIPLFAQKKAAEWVELAEAAGIPATVVNNIGQVMRQEQAALREMIVPTGQDGVRSAGIPIKLGRTPGSLRKPPPSRGADTDQILTKAGFNAEELKALRDDRGSDGAKQ
jgi:crotonobetainyl-CoA:carnitine CoA-transferase CaiB-like acyl-CoA transferase